MERNLYRLLRKIKKNIAETALLAYPKIGTHLVIVCDASDNSLSAGLQLQVEGKWELLAFFFKKLSPTKMLYSTFDRELLAVYEATKFFRHMLKARVLMNFTNHKRFIYAIKQKQDKAAPRQSRYSSYIREFTTLVSLGGYEAGRVRRHPPSRAIP